VLYIDVASDLTLKESTDCCC